ncbi:MAG: PAP2 family protein [Draconibacterium sp.]|nr:PAP2 family protein [Draconibacterium sp.]
MATKFAKIISIVFHPVLIPTLGFLLLFNSGFYFSMLNWDAKRIVLLVVLFSTCILPLISVAILALNPKFDISMEKSQDRVIPLLSSAIFYYIGFVLLGRMEAFPVFKLFLVASVFVIIALLLISFKWKISNHMAAVGGITGTIFALSFRSGINPIWSILFVTIISGVIGTARLILNKHKLDQILAGYSLGFSVLYLIIYFI